MTYPQPPDVFDILTVHFCEAFGDNNCERLVDVPGETCDECLVKNAEACGDWDPESIAAAKRLGKTLPELCEDIKEAGMDLKKSIEEHKAWQQKCRDFWNNVSQRNRRA